MRLLGVLLILAMASTAHAELTLVAWNKTGTAALVAGFGVRRNLESAERVSVVVYIVSAKGDTAEMFELWDAPDCERAPAALRKALARHGFSGVTVRGDGCTRDKWPLVASAAVQRTVQRSWVTLPYARAGTQREQNAVSATDAVHTDPVCTSDGVSGGFDVAAVGPLYLVFGACPGQPQGSRAYAVMRVGEEMVSRHGVQSD
ncbi:MAG TPA: hypothetical protein VGM90_39015 [Kofleriaceae bacterium]